MISKKIPGDISSQAGNYPYIYYVYPENQGPNKIKYSIVIPTYNHCDDFLRPCIESLVSTTDLENVEIIVVANGCTDNTHAYLQALCAEFDEQKILDHIKVVWSDAPLGYSKATNAGIKIARGEKIVLLNNDVVLLPQQTNMWINLLSQTFDDPECGIAGVVKHRSTYINHDFMVFFCVMIDRKVFDKIGLLNENYGVGGHEDTEFCVAAQRAGFKVLQAVSLHWSHEANMWAGGFPMYHKGEGTVHDKTLVPNWDQVFSENAQRLINYYNQIKCSIIIPTYNHCDDLLVPCIDSILKYTNMAEVELIISANGCVDNTKEYLNKLRTQFESQGLGNNFRVVWNAPALGYAKACNEAIKVATTNKIILLNNDTVLLGQDRDTWIKILTGPFNSNPKAGISCIIKGPSAPAGHDFAVFFCVMIDKKVFDKIGLLNEEYGVGGGEDTEFCIEAERAGFEVCLALDNRWDDQVGMYTGGFPIYHKGEGTMHDPVLVPNHSTVFLQNSLILARKYNHDWYRFTASNNFERAVFLPGDPVLPCEDARYRWARENLLGTKIFELGCSNGYGTQYFPKDIEYIGCDYDPLIVWCAQNEGWGDHCKFVNADINTYDLGQYDTIIAFEVIEHLDNGLELVERFKKHCKRLLITVPHMEPPGFWGPYHKLHMLNESHFQGFKFNYINAQGVITDTLQPVDESNRYNLLIMSWTNNE